MAIPWRGLTHASLVALVLRAGRARADDLDAMHLLAKRGLHDLTHERWNAYGQVTFIGSYKPPFAARYTNSNGSPNSLLPSAEGSFTASATMYLAARLWRGAEAHLVPEVIALRPLSNLKGLGGAIQNFELQKSGSVVPQLYRSRAYLQQTLELGGDEEAIESKAMQLGRTSHARRLTVRAGSFSVIDFFDKNELVDDPRQQFFNMTFMTYAAYDFAADSRGYTWGGMAELRWDEWALRIARMAPPKHPNELALDPRIFTFYGDQVELQHDHELFGQKGALRLLAYRNRLNTGRFDDAVAAYAADPGKNAAACTGYDYDSANSSAPDLCWVRRPNVKVGLGLNVEQWISPDVGVFFRGMISDGRTEVYAFGSTDRSLAYGAVAHGAAWHRSRDLAGVGMGLGWISSTHAEYLRRGGIDGFIGDGTIRPAAETIVEAFYSVNLASALWLSADYQHVVNPAFNADRGPVNILGARAHAEF